MKCKICESEMEFEECGACDDGYYDGYDDDPMWYAPGDLVFCQQCGGVGGWWVCPNIDEHIKQNAAQHGVQSDPPPAAAEVNQTSVKAAGG